MPINMRALTSIKEEDVYMVPARVMNDVFEGAAFSSKEPRANDDEEEIERIQNGVYIKSFSYAKNNNLMWSHYGDAHKGICIGYDFSNASAEVKSHLFPVQYSNTRFSHDNLEGVAAHPFLYLRKSSCWRYEKEWRLLYTKSELEDIQQIKLDCISEVQFGLRTPPDAIKQVADMIQEMNWNRPNRKIRMYQTEYKEDSFCLERKAYVKTDF